MCHITPPTLKLVLTVVKHSKLTYLDQYLYLLKTIWGLAGIFWKPADLNAPVTLIQKTYAFLILECDFLGVTMVYNMSHDTFDLFGVQTWPHEYINSCHATEERKQLKIINISQ